MIKRKQAQGELITTVLIILVVLAAVAFVATFIMNQVKTTTTAGANKADCLKLNLEITQAINNANNITVKRNDEGSVNISKIVVNVAGATWNSSAAAPDSLSTLKVINSTSPGKLATGQKVSIDVLMTNGATCAEVTSATVTSQ